MDFAEQADAGEPPPVPDTHLVPDLTLELGQELAELEEAWLQAEAAELERHLRARALAAAYCERARVASALLGRLP
jgi:hypothetical protein